MLNSLFRDDIDSTRFVRPVSVSKEHPKCYVVKVYFNDARGLSYVGLAEAPTSLFGGSAPVETGFRSNRWTAPAKVGYSPISEEEAESSYVAAISRKEAKEAKARAKEDYNNR